MTTDWQAFFETWAAPPSQTEIDERDRTEKQISDALKAWPAVARRNYRLFVKGSYRSRTNIRRGSDIDIGVELVGATTTGQSFIVGRELQAKHLNDAQLGLVDAPVEYAHAMLSFKDDCLAALTSAFGPAMVTRNNKCITVSEKSTTLPADVVPCTTYRRFDSARASYDGIEIRPDRGTKVVNWPAQDYDNGVAKNSRTSKRYKRVVRGLKALEDRMCEQGHPETSSWLIECLVYNVPDGAFSSPTNYLNVLSALLWLVENLGTSAGPSNFMEVNELKRLFAPAQPWTASDASQFVSRSIRFITAEAALSA